MGHFASFHSDVDCYRLIPVAGKTGPKVEEGKTEIQWQGVRVCRANRSRGQGAAARGVREGVLRIPARMVMHTSTETFDIEVNHVFQLFGERHCCRFQKDDLQVQPKPAH